MWQWERWKGVGEERGIEYERGERERVCVYGVRACKERKSLEAGAGDKLNSATREYTCISNQDIYQYISRMLNFAS